MHRQRTAPHRRWLPAVAGALIVVLLATSCASDDAGGDESSSDAPGKQAVSSSRATRSTQAS
jgi:hypothetical protein